MVSLSPPAVRSIAFRSCNRSCDFSGNLVGTFSTAQFLARDEQLSNEICLLEVQEFAEMKLNNEFNTHC